VSDYLLAGRYRDRQTGTNVCIARRYQAVLARLNVPQEESSVASCCGDVWLRDVTFGPAQFYSCFRQRLARSCPNDNAFNCRLRGLRQQNKKNDA